MHFGILIIFTESLVPLAVRVSGTGGRSGGGGGRDSTSANLQMQDREFLIKLCPPTLVALSLLRAGESLAKLRPYPTWWEIPVCVCLWGGGVHVAFLKQSKMDEPSPEEEERENVRGRLRHSGGSRG